MEDDVVTLPREDFEELLAVAAEKGARRALLEVGLDGEDAKRDVGEIRSFVSTLRKARETAWQTVTRIVTTLILAVLIAYIAPSMAGKINIWGH